MNALTKFAIIIPYYGKFPWYFDFFLHSASFNPSVDILIVTDLQKPDYCPDNVHFIKMSLQEVRLLASNKLNLDVKIDYPYKLCDLKPAYGYIFSDLLQPYPFWGIGDIDVIYGNIREFITEELLSTFDVISVRPEYISGFFCLYRNIQPVNELFMESRDYRKVYSDPRLYFFDECSNKHDLLVANVSVYDIDWEIQSMTYITRKAHDEGRINALFDFFVIEYVPGRLKWDHGTLSYNNKWEAMLYHMNHFKRTAKIPKMTYHTIPDCYFIKKVRIVPDKS